MVGSSDPGADEVLGEGEPGQDQLPAQRVVGQPNAVSATSTSRSRVSS